MLHNIFNIMVLLGSSYQDVSNIRQSNSKTVLPRKLREPCAASRETSDILLGDDLLKPVKGRKGDLTTEHDPVRQP